MRFCFLISMFLLTLSVESNDYLSQIGKDISSQLERLNREKTKFIAFNFPCKITHQTLLESSQKNSAVYNGIKDGWKPNQNFFLNIEYSLYENDFLIALTLPQFESTKRSFNISFWSEEQTTPLLKVWFDDFTVEFQRYTLGGLDSLSNPNYLWPGDGIKLHDDFIEIKENSLGDDADIYFERYKENSNKWFMSYSSKPGYQSMLVAAECENMPEEYNQLLDTMRDHYKLSRNIELHDYQTPKK